MRFLVQMLILLPVLALTFLSVGCSQRSSRAVTEADKLMGEAFLKYAQGSFESASNSLQKCAAYLDANEKLIGQYRDTDAVDLNGKDVPFTLRRDIPVMQFAPHSMLACMMIYAGNTNEAVRHLSRAYPYHVQIWTRTGNSPVPRGDFVDFILDGREKIDGKTGALWKSQFKLDTNVVNGILTTWMQQTESEHR